MASKTLYDILEVSLNASPDSIRAAYERLSAKFPENSAIPAVQLQGKAITEAYLTLSNPVRRTQYDKRLAVRSQPVLQNVESIEPFWTVPKLIALAFIVIVVGGYYYKYSKEEARLAAEKAIAIAKAKEAEEKAKAEAEQQQFELAKQREEALQDAQQRRDRETALRQANIGQRMNQIQNDFSARSKALQDRMAQQQQQQQQQREEAQAAAAARQQLARDKAELCRKERENYGHAISC
jgi:curved DNA-binding protein CbpA